MQARSYLAMAALAFTLVAPSSARAARFDVIYADQFDLTLCDICEMSLSGADFALFVNKSATPIDYRTFNSIKFIVVSSVPDLQLQPSAFPPAPSVLPIENNVAVGNILPSSPDNTVLITKLLPGESFHQAHTGGTLSFTVWRRGPYEGPVTCTVMMMLGQDIATLDIHFAVHQGGENNITFLSAARASSTVPTPTANTTWGRLKALFR